MKDLKNYAESEGCDHHNIVPYGYLQWRCRTCEQQFFSEETIQRFLLDLDEQIGNGEYGCPNPEMDSGAEGLFPGHLRRFGEGVESVQDHAVSTPGGHLNTV